MLTGENFQPTSIALLEGAMQVAGRRGGGNHWSLAIAPPVSYNNSRLGKARPGVQWWQECHGNDQLPPGRIEGPLHQTKLTLGTVNLTGEP